MTRYEPKKYTDRHGQFVGRVTSEGYVRVVRHDDGTPATRLHAPTVKPVGSKRDATHAHPPGIVLRRLDAIVLGIPIETPVLRS